MRVISVNSIKVVCAAVSAVVLSTSGSFVHAFKPEYESYGHTMITRSVLEQGYSFGVRPDQTAYEVPAFQYSLQSAPLVSRKLTYLGVGPVITGVKSRDWGAFSPDNCAASLNYYGIPNFFAREPVTVFYGWWPKSFCISKDLNDVNAHFDSDNFLGSRSTIRSHTGLAIDYARRSLNESDQQSDLAQELRAASRIMIGKALHTLQDFYAHSNWAETVSDESLALMWTDNILSTDQTFSSAESQTLAAPIANKEGTALVGGGAASVPMCQPEPKPLRADSWGSNDGNYSLYANTKITTGAWWDGLTGADTLTAAASDDPRNSRCDHGVTDANELAAIRKFSGLAKDMPGWPLAPAPQGKITGTAGPAVDDYGREGLFTAWPTTATDPKSRAAADATGPHLKASFLAAKHSRLYLDKLVEAVQATYPNPVRADEVLVAMFGGDAVPRGKGWVLDRSGTMYDVLPQIKAEIAAQLQPGVRYVLADFKSSSTDVNDFGFVWTVGDESVVRARLDAIEARGGDGCQAPVWQAVYRALQDLFWESTLTIYTDASASDVATYFNKAGEVASRKHIAVNAIVSGSCSPLDSSYSAAAQNTGGALLLVEQSSAGVSLGSSIVKMAGETQRVVHSESAVLTGSKTVAFPIESGASSLTIIASGAITSVAVTQPSGNPLAVGAGVTASQTLNGVTFVIPDPSQGIWQVTFIGSGSYALSTFATSNIAFLSVETSSVLKTGRPGHEYRPPLAPAGQSGRVWIRANIVNAQAPVTLDLLRMDGSVVNSFPLTKMTADHFEGEITLPTEAHRFRVRGLAANGTAFARIYGQGNAAPPPAASGQITASVGVTGTWRGGTVNAFAINLKNLGGSDTVSLVAGTLPTGATMTCNPGSITLPGSEQVNVLCSLYLPETVDRTDFTVNVTSATSAQAVTVPLTPLKLPLSCALDVDGDNRVDPAVDGLLLTRYLLGFRGAALTQGLTIGGPRKTSALVEAFFGNAAQFDVIGRASPAPSAMVDGLIMTRLMLGVDDAGLLSGINLPAGALFASAAAIRANVIAKCAGGF